MPKSVPLPSFEKVDRFLRYEPDSGELFWRVNRRGIAKSGERAGCINSRGYIQIAIGKRPFLAHRLAWLLTYGEMPDVEIDHRNGNKSDNRLSNLRLATRTQNGRNRRINSNSTTGFKGVRRHRDKFQAAIKCEGNTIYLGTFASLEEANVAYQDAAERLFGEFAYKGE